MDVRWKDGKGNILNANKEKIIYLDVDTNIKTKLTKEEVKKITIEDGLMNIFKDFENDLVLTIVIPKKSKRNAVRIYNEYDKTGEMIKGKSNNVLLNLILESSVILGNPLAGIITMLIIFSIMLSILTYILEVAFGSIGINIARLLVFGYPTYTVISYILTRIKRKKLKEV